MVTMVLAGGVSAWFPECYHLRKCTLTATYSLSLSSSTSTTGYLIICNGNNNNFQLYILTEGAHESAKASKGKRE